MSAQVAVVILNWNGKHFLEQFLGNVITHSEPHQVILADNASTDDSIDFVRTHYPEVRIIRNDENGGFAKGYNDALRHVDAKFYVLLNSDVEVTDGWLNPLLAAMQDEQVAGCQPKIKSYERRNEFEHAGAVGGFLDKDFYPFCRGRIFDKIETDNGQYNDTVEVFWATGACMMIRADLFHNVGGLDEDFFAHMEEIDLCWRLKRLGYKFMAVGQSEVFHVGGGTLDYLSPRKTYLNFRNSLYMILKNHDGWVTGKIFLRLCLDGLAAIRFLINGNYRHIHSLLFAHIDFYKNARKMKKKRRAFESSHHLQPNLTGIYPRSILWKRFVNKVSCYSELDV
jgi:GT2 family glycosyltransferase